MSVQCNHRPSRQPVRIAARGALAAAIGLAAVSMMGGCPAYQNPVEFITGSTGDRAVLAAEASVDVYSPQSDLSIGGGTPVEVNWRAVGRTTYSTVDVILDEDTNPDNDNETLVYNDLTLTDTTALIDTSTLEGAEYYVGVVVQEVGETVAFDYAPGTVTINQAPTLFFLSPRDNFRYDRTPRINPSFDVIWTLDDPDSTVTTDVFLDPDDRPNGNEILLRTSGSQEGDSFTFDLPTASFEAGTYRILALVSDGVDTTAFYAPGSIQLRSRLAGYLDLRGMYLPGSTVRGAIFEGFNPRDNAGSFVSSLRDVDGDGFDDFIILAQFAKPTYESNVQRTGVGEAYMVFGRANSFTGLINLNSTGTLFRGDIFLGVPEVTDPIRPSRGITSFTLLTDWDRDGVRELAFGLPFTDSASTGVPLDPAGYFRTGAVVVIAGSALRPDLGFPGRQTHYLGYFGTFPHLAISDAACAEGFIGPKYAVLDPTGGGPSGSTLFHGHLLDPADPRTGGFRLGCRFSSHDFGDQFGESISSWDFHGLLMSAPNRDPAVSIAGIDSNPGGGVISLFFCHVFAPFFPWNVDNAPPANSDLGYAGSPGNPMNSEYLPHGGPYHYVLDDLRRFVDTEGSFVPGAPGYTVDPDDNLDPCEKTWAGTLLSTTTFWSSVSGAGLNNATGLGDFNADGLLELAIGAPLAEDGSGICYIVFGRHRNLMEDGELQLEELGLPMDSSDPASERIFDGIRVVGTAGERLGQAQDDAGDFNSDGLADVLIGSPLLNNRRGGAAVFFGSRDIINLTEEEIPFGEIPDRGYGVIFVGEREGDLAGARVCSAGDVDSDGNDDILIAAPNRSVTLDIDLDGALDVDRTDCGVVYLVYGSPSLTGTISLSLVGTDHLPGAVFIGRNSGDHIGAGLGEHGDRSFAISTAGDVDGDGFGDLLFGAVAASPRDRAHAGEAYLIYGTGE